MTSYKDDFYMKIVALDEIYNFLVLSFFIWYIFLFVVKWRHFVYQNFNTFNDLDS